QRAAKGDREIGGDEPEQRRPSSSGDGERRPPCGHRVSLISGQHGRREGSRPRRRVCRVSTAPPCQLLSTLPILFDKIIGKEIPSQVVYEDQKILAFRDISPQAPIHIIIIPKVKDGLSRLSKAEERHVEVLGSLLYAAKIVAKQEGLDDGFRIVINDGPKGCQSVYHLHVHLLGG
ncbi:unnamed protein product, partial [Urochloa humidicola]